jgi:hypothetical protein
LPRALIADLFALVAIGEDGVLEALEDEAEQTGVFLGKILSRRMRWTFGSYIESFDTRRVVKSAFA